MNFNILEITIKEWKPLGILPNTNKDFMNVL